VATIDPNFRADVNRSVCVFGELTDELVSTLALEILHLRSLGDAPITVFINSNGGNVRCVEYIRDLLFSGVASGRRPRIITVAVGNAGSAAATLLALGDYAITYSKASIFFHGVRYSEVVDVTMESASSMAAQLESKNRATASMLAEAGTMRLAFHYARSKDDFQKIRDALKKPEKPDLTDIECFAHYLKANLSLKAKKIVDKAISQWLSLQKLSNVLDQPNASGKQGLEFEATVLKSVIEYEVEKHKHTKWILDDRGIFQIASDYLLLRDYDVGRHVRLIETLITRFSHAFFSPEEINQFDEAAGNKSASETVQQLAISRGKQTIKPFCYFASMIWRGLQQDENPLSSIDAYWLGAVDEVYDSKLPCLREVVESQDPEQPDLPASDSTPPPAAPSAPSAPVK
jgi:ATP-dependent protease ClpP protease subunit